MRKDCCFIGYYIWINDIPLDAHTKCSKCYFDYKYERQHQTCFMQTLNAVHLIE